MLVVSYAQFLGQNVMWCKDCLNRSTGATCARDEQTERKKESLQGKKCIACRMEMNSGWSSVDSSESQEILWKKSNNQLRGFWDFVGSNMPSAIELAIGLYNAAL